MNNIDYQKELNPEQLEVVLHGDGPCLVLAGAGSGKTRTVTYRVAYLLEQGISPNEILLLTFTNKAAKEMLNRVTALTNPSPLGRGETGVKGGTFHSTASRILRTYAPLVGHTNGFTILDEDDSKALIKLCLKDAGADGSRDKRFPSPNSFQSMYSYSRNAGVGLRQVLEDRSPALAMMAPTLEHVIELYEDRKHTADAVDFDDLLLLFLELLEKRPDVRERLATQFRYVLVDEFQDTNRIQARIVQLLSSVHRNLLVVGDDAQSIYSFRAAEIKNILDFPQTYPGTKVFRLTANYRSSPQILGLANAIIKNNRQQFDKPLIAMKKEGNRPKVVTTATITDEARHVADEIVRLKASGVPTKEIAVLFRAAFHAQPLEYELMKRNTPYEFRGGMRFFERAHIKDVTSHLRVLANLKDEAAWLRVLGLYPGIGASTAGKILDQVRQFETLAEAISPEGLSPTRAASGWELCRGVLKHMLAATHPSDMIRAVVAQGYRDYLEAEQPDFRDRLDDLEQFATFAESATDLTTFLDDVTLAENYGAARTDPAERIILSTIHQAKGLEWDAVFVIGLRDGGFPNPRALAEGTIEEERRLFYVATTRARDRLYLTYALSDNRGGSSDFSFGQPSMFLSELPRGIMEEKRRVGKGPEGLGRDWGEFDDGPTIVLDKYGETKPETKKRSGFLRDIDEL
ncbi:MAG: ATP-dependent helicase [Patescibacteria group bacterium]